MYDYWEVTAQMFGALFSKPKMTEQLLTKPPFKYLFDIITQTTKATGFAKGLYTNEELSRDFYDTREKKIYFLEKIIALTRTILKEDLEVNPAKIVAGFEPEKTNLFLQAVYRAATSGEDSGPYVPKINERFSQKEEKTTIPEELPRREAPHQEEPRQEEPSETFFNVIEPKQEEIRMAHRPGRGKKITKVEAGAESSKEEIESIQKLIQNIVQNVNPLGRSMDFVDDDIEVMNKEMKTWRREFLDSKERGRQEQANTEEELEPLRNKLAEIEEMIRQKKSRIQATKPYILQNEQRIQKLLYSVTGNK